VFKVRSEVVVMIDFSRDFGLKRYSVANELHKSLLNWSVVGLYCTIDLVKTFSPLKCWMILTQLTWLACSIFCIRLSIIKLTLGLLASSNRKILSYNAFWEVILCLIKLSSRRLLVITRFFEFCSACLVAAKEAKVSEKEAPSVTERSFGTTFKASPSPPSVVLLAVAVSSVSLAWFMKRLVEFSKFSLRMWSVMLWLTPSTPNARPWPPWMWCTLSSAKDVPCTDSVVKLHVHHHYNKNGSFRSHQISKSHDQLTDSQSFWVETSSTQVLPVQ